jgi:hypothetical protein
MLDFATFSPKGEKFLGVEESPLDNAYKKEAFLEGGFGEKPQTPFG